MKTALLLTLLLAAFWGCQPKTDEIKPDVLRNDPVSLTARDVEFARSSLTASYERVFNETQGLNYGVTKTEISIDVSDIRPAVEAFMAAHPNDYGLYFRLELRRNQSDLVLPDGSRKFRAGALPAGVSIEEIPTHGGPAVYAKQPPYAWDRVATELQTTLREMLRSRLRTPQALKLMLSVYDLSRMQADPTTWGAFDGSTAKSHADGGSRVLYRGWNLEVK